MEYPNRMLLDIFKEYSSGTTSFWEEIAYRLWGHGTVEIIKRTITQAGSYSPAEKMITFLRQREMTPNQFYIALCDANEEDRLMNKTISLVKAEFIRIGMATPGKCTRPQRATVKFYQT